MTIYYKGVQPDGTDFYAGTIQWAPVKALEGHVVKHPTSTTAMLDDFSTLLSVSTDPTRLPGSSWPLRLLEVEPVGDVLRVSEFKRGGVEFRVVREVDPSIRFGPMGAHVVALIDRARLLTADEANNLHAAQNAARVAAWVAAWVAAQNAARVAAREAAREAARVAAWGGARDAARYGAMGAAGAVVVRDLIGSSHGFTQEHYDTLTGPWRKVIGPIHPDDKELT